MSDHIASDRFLRILHELHVTFHRCSYHRSGTGIGGDLVDDDDGYVELLGHCVLKFNPILRFFRALRCLPSFCCRSASSPRPL